jgi:hypothetical protein
VLQELSSSAQLTESLLFYGLQHRVRRAVPGRHLRRRNHRPAQLPLGTVIITSLLSPSKAYKQPNFPLLSRNPQSFEEATRALRLVQPSVLAVDNSFASWAIQLTANKVTPSVTLCLLVGGTPSTSHAAADCTISLHHVQQAQT